MGTTSTRSRRRTALAVIARTVIVLIAATALAPTAAVAAPSTTQPAQDTTTSTDQVIATSPAVPAAPAARIQVVGIDYVPGGLVITGHGGKTVTATARGQRARSVRPASATTPARFTRMAPGTAVTIAVAGTRVATATVLARPGTVRDLVVRTTADPGSVLLTWQYVAAAKTGPVTFHTVATPIPGQAVTVAVIAAAPATAREAVLTSLDPHTLYRFSVAAVNPAGSGPQASASITRTLGDLTGSDAAALAAAPAAATHAAAQAEAARRAVEAAAASATTSSGSSASGGTRTVYTCPDGYIDTGTDCTKTLAYTFHPETITLAYTYHAQATGSAPIVDSYTTTGTCPGGYNLEDYGWVKYCRKYGAIPTTQVKDAAPDGYTDTGTAWSKTVDVKDAAPDGYTDTGTAWVTHTPKTAHTVPA